MAKKISSVIAILFGMLMFLPSCKNKHERSGGNVANDMVYDRQISHWGSIETKLLLLKIEGDTTQHDFIEDPEFSDKWMPPRYEGGWEGFQSNLKSVTRYPTQAQESGIEGRVVVRFRLNEKGVIDDIIIFRGVGPWIDKEVQRALMRVPRLWIPAIRDHKLVNSEILMAFDFKIDTRYYGF